MKILKQEKGSITLFVLISMIFFTLFIVGMYMITASSESTQIAETDKIKQTYEQGIENIDEVYNTLISNNKNVNAPVYYGTGLTPVIINSDGTTNTVTSEENWYSYDGKQNHWANAKTKDGSMWVWIPRFAYKITNNTSGSGTIDIVFLSGTTNNDFYGNDVTLSTYKDEQGVTGAYTVHPAFKDGRNNGYANGEWGKEITGFWIAKFEAGYVGTAGQANTATDSNIEYSTLNSWNINKTENLNKNFYGDIQLGTKIKYPTFQANRPSMNFISISDAYDLCMSFKDATDVYGMNNIDSHLTKNSEWGAVAYLAHSKYGRNGTEITINNVSLQGTDSVYAVTGFGGESISASEITTTWDKIENKTQSGNWTTNQGQTASTTGNIYGVYDISGGLWEWTTGYINVIVEPTEENSTDITGNFGTYGKSLSGESNKYETKYFYSESGQTNTSNYSANGNTSKKGEAIWETSTSGSGNTSWNNDYSCFVFESQPFSARGGMFNNGQNAGSFAIGTSWGYCSYADGFRAVLIAE